jgi:hypothetical protein
MLTNSHANNHAVSHANSHAPIGVMGDHLHQKNQWMFSYRFMRMEMADNLQGSNNISSEKIVTTVPNRFFWPAYDATNFTSCSTKYDY